MEHYINVAQQKTWTRMTITQDWVSRLNPETHVFDCCDAWQQTVGGMSPPQRPHPREEGHTEELPQTSRWKEMLQPTCQNSQEVHFIPQHFWCSKLTGSDNLDKLLQRARENMNQSPEMPLTAGRRTCTTEEQIYHCLITTCCLAFPSKISPGRRKSFTTKLVKKLSRTAKCSLKETTLEITTIFPTYSSEKKMD